MIKDKLKIILTFNGIAYAIGILGSLASILTVFVTNWNTLVNIKWLVLVLFLAFSIILILIKLVFDFSAELRKKHPVSLKVLRYIPHSLTFIVNVSDALGYSAMVSIFYMDDEFEIEFGKGYVSNIQDEFIQVQLIDISNDFLNNYGTALVAISNNDYTELKKLFVKGYIRYTN